MMLLVCAGASVCVCDCACTDGLFGNINPLSIGYCYWWTGDDQVTASTVLPDVFFSPQLDKDNSNCSWVFFPLAGIMVPGVIVHLLCISVIFAKL